jgi:SM-20-related protein
MSVEVTDDIVGRLAREGVATLDEFIEDALTLELLDDITRREAAGLFRPAGIGAGRERTERRAIRGDRISWLSLASSTAEQQVLSRLEDVRRALNEALFLGLHDLESHFAIYDPSTRYVRHLDRSVLGAERVVSIVLYLNRHWRPSQGGELRLYTAAGEVEVTPVAGRLVMFLSDQIEHEVLVSHATRRSLTGWFRRRPVLPLA